MKRNFLKLSPITLGITLLSLSATGCGSGSSRAVASSVDLSHTVPWVNQPGQMYFAPPVATTAPASDAPPCKANQLSIKPDGRNGATGEMLYYFSFVNVSSSTCILKGLPRVVASQPGHPDVTADGVSKFFTGQDPVASNIAPGQSATLTMGTNDGCTAKYSNPGARVYDTITVYLPSGDSVVVHQTLDLSCGLENGAFNVYQPPVQSEPLSWMSLDLRLELPKHAQLGSVMEYVVDLTNPTDKAIDLVPCPSYYQGMNKAGYEALLFNCKVGGQIPAHKTLRYKMQISLPGDLPTGIGHLYWSFASIPSKRVSGTTLLTAKSSQH